MPIEGEWGGRVTGLRGQRVEIAMMLTPDGHSRLELSRFDAPAIASDHRTAPVNSLGYLRVMFTVENIVQFRRLPGARCPAAADTRRTWRGNPCGNRQQKSRLTGGSGVHRIREANIRMT
jgi:hypothetical protein